MKKFKSINIMDNMGFWPEKASLIDAIKDILSLGYCEGQFPVKDFGHFRSPQWRDDDDVLVPWQSVDWYIYDSLNEERIQVNARSLLHNLSNEPWRDERLLGDHYDLFIMQEDMYLPDDDGNDDATPGYCVGANIPFTAAVISSHRLEHIWGMPYSCIKTEVMRQFCFLFGLPSTWRDDVTHHSDGKAFCNNICILRDVQHAPEEWESLTEDRLREGALCESCEDDLRCFFKKHKGEVQSD